MLQPHLIPTPESTPLRRSLTSATFGDQPILGAPETSPSIYPDMDKELRNDHVAPTEHGYTPQSIAMERGDARLTATSFGTLGQFVYCHCLLRFRLLTS